MLEIVRSSQFKKDLKKIIKQGKDLELLEEIVNKLQHSEKLPLKNCDHLLS
ncbi:TPA: type II toxin-antitoxin system mRNA interferase toxin, RelE/StbE family, partial [Legionella pneumophila]|nr:type II toxin-antitoxin system mRNA interferase toxin, RelE/StbE family [Legionella pneumophila]